MVFEDPPAPAARVELGRTTAPARRLHDTGSEGCQRSAKSAHMQRTHRICVPAGLTGVPFCLAGTSESDWVDISVNAVAGAACNGADHRYKMKEEDSDIQNAGRRG